MAQADELARLRDEVRGSAEREAMEIVTAARRDIRQIVMEARRELFVLSAQVQAALGEGSPGAPQIGPSAIAHDDDRGLGDDDLSRYAQEEWGFAPRSTVAAVLEEARHDMAILDQDARAVPSRGATPDAERTFAAAAATEAPAPDDPRPADGWRSRLLASDPATLKLVGAFVLVSLLLVFGTMWMLQRPSDATGEAAPSDAAALTAPAEQGPAQAPREAAPAPPTEVSVSLEAVRPAWIRAVVDGRPDAGQMLQAGETYEFAGRTIALRIGDAGAVRVSVNGGAPATLGRDGQVVDREYTLDGAPTLPGTPQTERQPSGPAGPPVEPASTSSSAEPLPAAPAPLLSPEAAPSAVAGTNGSGTAPAPAAQRGEQQAEPRNQALLAAAQRWLDAYHRQDRVMLAVLSTADAVIADERPTGERMPIAAGAISRTLDRVSVQMAADTAVLTGVMTERAVDGGLQRSSPVSLVWVSNAGTWRLSQARLASPSMLGRVFP